METKLINVNDELRKTKENLEEAEDTIKQYKEEKVSLENKLSKNEYLLKEHTSQVDVASSKQTDVGSIFYYVF